MAYRVLALSVLLLICTSLQARECSKEFRILYIPFDVATYEPPIPMEKWSDKEFSLSSCAIEKLFSKIKAAKVAGTTKNPLARIKIINQKTKESIIIEKTKEVTYKGKIYSIDSVLKDEVINTIEAKAATLPSKFYNKTSTPSGS